MPDGPPGKGKGKEREKINAQFSQMPATECIGAGRLEGWFMTPAYICDGKGWGHIQSYCFEGDLFFHLQRSPLLRGINFQRRDACTFEVIEFNGNCEAVKLLVPRLAHQMENPKHDEDAGKPEPADLVGQRINGLMKSQWQLVESQNWGFCCSEHFAGQVFWHMSDSPKMEGIKFEREDQVEFEICIDATRGNEVRAKNMVFLGQGRRPYLGPKRLSEKKQAKREQWKRNWRKGHPPDWECKKCSFNNFGRNKICRKCEIGTRPPREEWPEEEEDFDDNTAAHLQPGDWRCPACNHINFSSRTKCRHCGTERPEFEDLIGLGQYKAPAGMQKNEDNARERKAPAPPPAPTMDQNPQQAKVAETLFGKFSPDENVQAQLHLCMGAFNDLVAATVPDADNSAIIEKVQALMGEVNGVLGDDKSAKHAFAMQIARHPWFRENGQEVRYKPSSNLIEVSKIQGHGAMLKGKGKGGPPGGDGTPKPGGIPERKPPPPGGAAFGSRVAEGGGIFGGRGISSSSSSGAWAPSWNKRTASQANLT